MAINHTDWDKTTTNYTDWDKTTIGALNYEEIQTRIRANSTVIQANSTIVDALGLSGTYYSGAVDWS
jgi:hypothetical protein